MIVDLRAEAHASRPDVPKLPHLTEAAIGTWAGRMKNEYGCPPKPSALATAAE